MNTQTAVERIYKMNRERLAKLADLLDTVPPSKFDMESFLEGDKRNLRIDKTGCGTRACAAGWASIIPEFEKDGYSISECGYPRLAGSSETPPYSEVLGKFFELDVDNISKIFFSEQMTPQQKAKQIRKLIAEAN